MVYATVVNRLAPEIHMSPEKGPFWKGNFIFQPAFFRGYDIRLGVTQVNKSKFQFYRPQN